MQPAPATLWDHSDKTRNLLQRLNAAGVAFTDLSTHQSSLEDIFVSLVEERT